MAAIVLLADYCINLYSQFCLTFVNISRVVVSSVVMTASTASSIPLWVFENLTMTMAHGNGNASSSSFQYKYIDYHTTHYSFAYIFVLSLSIFTLSSYWQLLEDSMIIWNVITWALWLLEDIALNWYLHYYILLRILLQHLLPIAAEPLIWLQLRELLIFCKLMLLSWMWNAWLQQELQVIEDALSRSCKLLQPHQPPLRRPFPWASGQSFHLIRQLESKRYKGKGLAGVLETLNNVSVKDW